MILAVSVDDERLVYSATQVDLDALEEGAIRAPEDGNEVSRAEYEEIVAEKLEELRMLGGPAQRDERARDDRRRDVPGGDDRRRDIPGGDVRR